MAADNAPIKGGLSTDPRVINFYGAQDADITEYQKSLDDSIKALQQRYAQPNWFNVAAGFFKPQLGGFAASLGSASEALGQNVERERESQLPIAQMRSQLAMSKIAMGQNRTAADLVKEWEGRGSPPGEMPALAQKLESLGASGLAGGIKGQIDTMRSTTASDQQALQIFYQKRAADVSAVQTQLAGKMITPAQAAAAMREIEGRTPPATTNFSPLGGTAKPKTAPVAGIGEASPAAVPAPVAAGEKPPAAPAAAPGTELPAVAVAAPVPEKKAKTIIPAAMSLHTETEMPQAQIERRTADAEAFQKNAMKTYEGLQAIAAPENFNKFVTPVDNSLRLLGYEPDPSKKMDPAVQAANQKMAQEALGMMKGSVWKAVLASVQEGLTGKVGDLYMNLSAPVKTFLTAKVPPDKQDYMRDLIQNFAQVAIQKQQLGGLNPSTGRNVEFNLFGESSPSFDHSTPKSALKNLLHMRTALYQTKAQHDFVRDVLSGNHPEFGTDPNSATQFYDVLSNPAYSALQKPWLEKHAKIEEHFGSK